MHHAACYERGWLARNRPQMRAAAHRAVCWLVRCHSCADFIWLRHLQVPALTKPSSEPRHLVSGGCKPCYTLQATLLRASRHGICETAWLVLWSDSCIHSSSNTRSSVMSLMSAVISIRASAVAASSMPAAFRCPIAACSPRPGCLLRSTTSTPGSLP